METIRPRLQGKKNQASKKARASANASTKANLRAKNAFSKHRTSGPMLSISQNFCLSVRLSVHLSVRLSVCFEVLFKRLFAPTSRSRMSNIFRDSESLGKSSKKKWSQIWTFLFANCLELAHNKKFFPPLFSLLRYRFFAPTSQSWMSNIFRDSESLGKSNGKKWSNIWTFFFRKWSKNIAQKKVFYLLILPYKKNGGNHASQCIRDLYSKGVSLIWHIIYFWVFALWMIFFSFFKKIGFWGILVPPSYGIGATICISREMLCLQYAGFFFCTLPLVIYSCFLLDAIKKDIFKCFIHMTDFFHTFFKHLATKISQLHSVLFLNMFIQPFFYANGWLHVTHTALFFHGGSVSSMSQSSFKCFMASFWSTLSTYFFIIYSSFSTKIYSLYFSTSFSKHLPSGPMLSISWNVRLSIRLSFRLSVRLSVCPSMCSLLSVWTSFSPHFPKLDVQYF